MHLLLEGSRVTYSLIGKRAVDCVKTCTCTCSMRELGRKRTPQDHSFLLSTNCWSFSSSRSESPRSNTFKISVYYPHLHTILLTRRDPTQTQYSSSCRPSTSSSNSLLSPQSACTPHRYRRLRYRYDRILAAHRCHCGT